VIREGNPDTHGTQTPTEPRHPLFGVARHSLLVAGLPDTHCWLPDTHCLVVARYPLFGVARHPGCQTPTVWRGEFSLPPITRRVGVWQPGVSTPALAWAGAGVPAKCEPRSGVIIKAGVQTPVWVSTPACSRAAERRHHKGRGVNPGIDVDGRGFDISPTPSRGTAESRWGVKTPCWTRESRRRSTP
jgi:hypothetical protein